MTRPAAILLAALALAVTAPSGGASAQEVVFPPGSRIGLKPPASWRPSPGAAGFQNPRTGGAILVIELPPAAFGSMAAGFTADALKAQGFALAVRDTLTIGDGEAILVSGEQSDGTRTAPKTILLAPEPGMTALVIGQLAPGASPEERQAVLTALRTVTFRPALTLPEQVSALPFVLRDMAGLRPVRVVAGTTLLMTDGANDAVQAASQPVLIVSKTFRPGPALDGRDAFARQLLGANTVLKDAIVERSQSFRQAGAEWHEIVAKARDAASGEPVVVMQTIRFEPGAFIQSVGVVRTEGRDAVMPRFRQAVDSLSSQDTATP